MSFDDVLDLCRERQIELWCDDGGQLRYRAPAGALDADLAARIKAERDAFVRFLQGGAWRSDPARQYERFALTPVQPRTCSAGTNRSTRRQRLPSVRRIRRTEGSRLRAFRSRVECVRRPPSDAARDRRGQRMAARAARRAVAAAHRARPARRRRERIRRPPEPRARAPRPCGARARPLAGAAAGSERRAGRRGAAPVRGFHADRLREPAIAARRMAASLRRSAMATGAARRDVPRLCDA
ncbi:hypothetical protein [Burkholderia anthina]|uniref:TubC N-terminal docking domain-related protein n=1 Tax=Burkholderia anthina TaxID=179879 RepID=UPI00292F11BD|nr:hypothetical protein [Burkholderia anthina]